MQFHLALLATLLYGTHLVSCIPYNGHFPSEHPQTPYDTETIYEWPVGVWAENLAVLRNGSILVTHLSSPQLWHVQPFSKTAYLIEEVSGYTGLLGITETKPGIFAFLAGNFSLETVSSTPGSYAVWQVDTHRTPFAVSKISDVPQATFLNGMDYLGPREHAVLITESDLGLIYRFDLTTGETTIAVDSPYLRKCRATDPEGINGLKVHGGYAYYTNAYCGFFARIPIDGAGYASGPSETLTYTDRPGTWIFDDLVVTHQGVAYLAGGTENVIVEAGPPNLVPDGVGVGDNLGNGTAIWARRNVAGNLNSTAIAEPTACRLGRTRRDRDVLYVTTGGALGGPVNGTTVVGGQLVAVKLSHSW